MAMDREFDILTFTISAAATTPGGANGGGKPLDNPAEIGMIVPALAPNASVKLQVSDDGATYYDVLDKTGGALLTIPANAGNYAVEGNALGACLPYIYIRPVLSVATTAQVVIKVIRKTTRSMPR